MYKLEIGEVLTRHLGPVAAPEELWERIENPEVLASVPTRHARGRALLALAATVLFAAVMFYPKSVEVEYRLPQHNLTLRVSKSTAAQPAEALNASCRLCHAGA